MKGVSHDETKNKYVTILGLVIAASFSFILGLSLANLSLAQAEEIDDNARPAPPSIGADVPLTYLVRRRLRCRKNWSARINYCAPGVVDLDAGTITLPLYQGRMKVASAFGISSPTPMIKAMPMRWG